MYDMKQTLELLRIFIIEFIFQLFSDTFQLLEFCRFEIYSKNISIEKCCSLSPLIVAFLLMIFKQNFWLRWDSFESNVAYFSSIYGSRFFIAIFLDQFFLVSQDKVKVARLDLFFLCVFPAFYVGFLLAYWIHFINRLTSEKDRSKSNISNE